MKLLQPTDADALRLARYVDRHPDAVNVLFYRPTIEAKEDVTAAVAAAANVVIEEEQRRRVVGYVRARRAIALGG
jgi:hypothetical protein